jgi:hypothetical protein
MRIGGLRVSMRFMGPEEGGVLQFQGLLGSSLEAYLLLGLTCLMLLPLPRVRQRGGRQWQRWVQWHIRRQGLLRVPH